MGQYNLIGPDLGNRYILLVMDYFMKWCFEMPLELPSDQNRKL